MTPSGRTKATGTRAARELLRRRAVAQGIGRAHTRAAGSSGSGEPSASGAEAIAEVVTNLLAVQAQDFGQASWALGLRAPGSTRDDLVEALDSGRIVRSWPMRGTLHFCTPDDLRMMLSITAARTVQGTGARHRQLGIDDALVHRAERIARSALTGGGSLTREEYFGLLTADGIDPGGQRGVHLIWLLAHAGVLCWGPARGSGQAMVLLDEWAPATRESERDEALGEFVLRYFTGHGPATLDDFCWWSKVTVAEAKRGLARVRDRLSTLELGGETFYCAADEVDDEGRAPAARLPATAVLPGFDEYLLGYRRRASALPEEFAERIVPGNNGVFLPMLVSHGTIVGTWKRAIGSRAVAVSLSPFTTLSESEQRGFERDLGRYARFLGLPLRMAAP